MEPFLPFANATLMSDHQISIAGVLSNADGILAQIGKGSFFVSRNGGRLVEAGGWGFTLSDECIGALLGREVLRAALRAHDGVDPGSHLTSQILASMTMIHRGWCSMPTALRHRISQAWRQISLPRQ